MSLGLFSFVLFDLIHAIHLRYGFYQNLESEVCMLRDILVDTAIAVTIGIIMLLTYEVLLSFSV